MTDSLKKYEEDWNLRYLNLTDPSLIESSLSEASLEALNKVINSFPDVDPKIISFTGDTFIGNLIYNYLIITFMESKFIRTKCVRITNSWQYDSIRELSRSTYDMRLLDNLEFSLYNNIQKEALNNYIETIYNQTKLIILNVPSSEDWEFAPKSLQKLISNHSLNILIKSKGTI